MSTPNFLVPPDYQVTLDRLRAAGLSNKDLSEAGAITIRRIKRGGLDDPWRYFCGVAWNMATDKMQFGSVAAEMGSGAEHRMH